MATAVHKTNMTIHRSVNTPDYPTEDYLINPASLSSLEGTVPSKYWKVNAGGDDLEEMTQGEKDAVDNDPDNLTALKAQRYEEITERSEELATENGFTYASKTFAMDRDAREKWIGLAVAHSLGILSFPQVVGTQDHDQYSISDAADFVTFFGAGLAAYKAIKEPGSDLKKSIHDATTKVAVDAITDTRT
jgi:hypothetical protein